MSLFAAATDMPTANPPLKRGRRPLPEQQSEAGQGKVGDRGFEPRTSALSERRSNRLS
jgi:hypothetical protein